MISFTLEKIEKNIIQKTEHFMRLEYLIVRYCNIEQVGYYVLFELLVVNFIFEKIYIRS